MKVKKKDKDIKVNPEEDGRNGEEEDDVNMTEFSAQSIS